MAVVGGRAGCCVCVEELGYVLHSLHVSQAGMYRDHSHVFLYEARDTRQLVVSPLAGRAAAQLDLGRQTVRQYMLPIPACQICQ